jgi:DNA polymerase III sliding clamp (beta) subunit (PCNA family)
MAVIPTSYLCKFEVNRKELLDALKALARGRKDEVPVKFKFTWDDTLELITEDKRGYARLKALCYGDNFAVWLNAQLLVDALEAFDCRRLTFLLTAEDGVVKVADADNEERMIYLIMPMNIKE